MTNTRSREAASTARAVLQLKDQVRGQILFPEDSGYDAARQPFYGGIDRRPAAIVKVADDEDVVTVVRFAAQNGFELAVRSGGHSVPGHSVSEGGIVIDLSAMKKLAIDVAGRTAWAEAGLTAVEFSKQVGVHGLAVGFGDTGTVGIGGITLGGGVGYLARKYGLTIDSFLAADVVTADGQIRRVDAQTNPDLFWALRGGGGNFGVVTRFKYQLQPVEHVVGGMLMLPATVDVITGFVSAAEAAPEELTTIVNVMTAPPMPFIPAEQHGKPVVMALMMYVGSAEDGQRVLAPFRALAKPVVDMLKPMTYVEAYPPEQEGYHPMAASQTMFLDSFDRGMAERILDQIGRANAMLAATQIRVLGGAVSRVPDDATAYAHRKRRIMANVAALFQDPADRPRLEAWASQLARSLAGDGVGAYVNFLGDEGPARVREAYPAGTWERLVEVKSKYDPSNLFRLNQNIPPLESAPGG